MIDMTGQATEHFAWRDARCKGADKIGCCHGLPEREEDQKTLLRTLQRFEAFRWFVSMCFAREVYLKENRIYSCEIWNERVGGSKNSFHMHYRAGDIDPRFKDSRIRVPMDKFGGMAVVFGYTGIIVNKMFAHLDDRDGLIYHKGIITPYEVPLEFSRLMMRRT